MLDKGHMATHPLATYRVGVGGARAHGHQDVHVGASPPEGLVRPPVEPRSDDKLDRGHEDPLEHRDAGEAQDHRLKRTGKSVGKSVTLEHRDAGEAQDH